MEEEGTETWEVVLGGLGIIIFFVSVLCFFYSFIGNRAQHALTKIIAFLVCVSLEFHAAMWFFRHVMEQDKHLDKVTTHEHYVIGLFSGWVVLLMWAAWEQRRAIDAEYRAIDAEYPEIDAEDAEI